MSIDLAAMQAPDLIGIVEFRVLVIPDVKQAV
jgi:hypothetical protein